MQRIAVGDKVDVYFESVDAVFNATVNHIPCATGDSWQLETDDGEVVYVQCFCKMQRRK